jgi:formylglycine-generating enzyme required for sulfatase activity
MIATTPQNSQNPNARAFTTTPQSEWRGVGGITWRTAAIYCNWLHNGKATNREAFLSGAYDVSTFGFAQPFGFSDQRERSPGAQYFIPSWDEWLKASHYDPSKQNSDGTTGGWWLYSNGTDLPLTYGSPPSQGGTGMANSGFSSGAFGIPLNSYPDVRTPWGLVDAAGMTSEWTEGVLGAGGSLEDRLMGGSAWTDSPGNSFFADQVIIDPSSAPDLGLLVSGFRIAAVVPSPSTFALGMLGLVVASRRRRLGGSDDFQEFDEVHECRPDCFDRVRTTDHR